MGHTENMSSTDTTKVSIRPEILALPKYVPGKPAQPGAAKLSSNENPYPPIPEVVAAMTKELMKANEYPQMASDSLTQALANHHQVPPSWIICEDGSVALLARALQAVCQAGDEVIMAWRSFEAYPIIVQGLGAKAVQVPLTEDGGHNLQQMAQKISSKTKAILLCSPNNPTGQSIRPQQLQKFMEQVPENVLVILDQAYVDFDTAPQVIDGVEAVREYPNLISARTFSKAYGMAGMRVGYVIAQEALAQAIAPLATPFAVNRAAAAGAIEILNHTDTVRSRVGQICQERDRIVPQLRKAGWQIPPTFANFFWLPAHGFDPYELTEVLARQGIVVRPFPEGVRISIGTPAQNDKVVTVLKTLRTPI